MGLQVAAFGLVQAILKLRGFITLPLVTSSLGPQGMGVYGALMSLNGLLQMAVMFGISTAIQVLWHHAPEGEPRRRQFWAAVQVCWLATAAGLALAGLAHSWLLPRFGLAAANREVIILALCLPPLTITYDLFHAQITNTLQAQSLPKAITAASVAELLLLFALIKTFGLQGLLMSMIFGLLIQILWFFRLVNRITPWLIMDTQDLPEVKRYYQYGAVIFLGGAFGWILDTSDRLIISRFLSLDQVGAYQVPYSLAAQAAQALSLPLYAALMPFATGAVSRGDLVQAGNYLARSFKFLLLVFIPMVAGLGILGIDLLRLLTQPAFWKGAAWLPWICTGICLFQLMGIFNYALHAHKKSVYTLFPLALGAAFNLSLNLIFVPRYGPLAAAVDTCIAYGVAVAAGALMARRWQPLPISGVFLLKALLAGATLAAALLAVKSLNLHPFVTLLAGGVLGMPLYGGALFALKVLEREDVVQLMSLVRKPRQETAHG